MEKALKYNNNNKEMEKALDEMENELKGVDAAFKEVRALYFKARRSPTVAIANSYLDEISKISKAAYNYIDEKGKSSFVFQYDIPHFCADSNNVSESFNNLLNKKDLNGKSARSSTIFGTMYRFICLTLDCLIKRKKCLDYKESFEATDTLRYNHFCRYVVKQLVKIGYRYEVLKNRYQVQDDCSVFDSDWDCIFHVDFSTKQCSCMMWQQTLILVFMPLLFFIVKVYIIKYFPISMIVTKPKAFGRSFQILIKIIRRY